MDVSFASAFVLLFLVIDPVGNIPLFQAILERVETSRRGWIVVRESLIAFAILLAFLLVGRPFLALLHISETSLGIAGGVILFLIALRILFHPSEPVFGEIEQGDPLIVPLAVPLVAGPSAMATVMLLASRGPERIGEWAGALTLAVAASTCILLLGGTITRLVGPRMILAFQRLMGLVLTAIAVEMFLDGIKKFVLDWPK
jgi:MarC family membrane protein